MKYQFVRMQDDGKVHSMSPHRLFDSVEAAKAAAPDFLATRRGGGKIVLIEVLEVAIASANVRYETYGKGVKVQKA